MEWMDGWLASCWSSSSSEEEAFQETTLKFHLASPQTTVAAATGTTATMPMTLCSRTRSTTITMLATAVVILSSHLIVVWLWGAVRR